MGKMEYRMEEFAISQKHFRLFCVDIYCSPGRFCLNYNNNFADVDQIQCTKIGASRLNAPWGYQVTEFYFFSEIFPYFYNSIFLARDSLLQLLHRSHEH